jgi:hypothetical protein
MMDRALLPIVTTPKPGCAGHSITCHVNFFESGHGKGPWDAAGGWLKNLVHRQAIFYQHTMKTPEEIATFVNQHHSKPEPGYNRQRYLVSRRCIVIPEHGEGAVDYNARSRAAYCIKGIRKLHQFACMGGGEVGLSDLVVHYRPKSCYCLSCMSFCDNDDYHDNCDNKHVVEAYQYVQMRAGTDTTQVVFDNYRDDLADKFVEFEVDIITRTLKPGRGPTPSATDNDCFVAIYHDDTEYKGVYDFYIMYVTEGPVQVGP